MARFTHKTRFKCQNKAFFDTKHCGCHKTQLKCHLGVIAQMVTSSKRSNAGESERQVRKCASAALRKHRLRLPRERRHVREPHTGAICGVAAWGECRLWAAATGAAREVPRTRCRVRCIVDKRGTNIHHVRHHNKKAYS